MKQSLLLAALGLASAGAFAQSITVPVISSTPIVQQVQSPRQACGQPMMVQQPTSGGGALLGAIIGGLVGSQIGGGSGRTAGLMVGTLGGAAIGNSVEANNQPPMAVPQCTTESVLENRTVGYNVTYEVDGRQYTVQMPQDPGPTIRLQMSPTGSNMPPPGQQPYAGAQGSPVVVAPPYGGQAPMAPAPVYSGYPQPVYGPPVYAQPVYPAPYYRPYPPVQLNLGIGYTYRGGHYH